MKVKKLLNDPYEIVDEMLEGIVGAHPELVRQLPHSPRALVRADAPRPGKVGILIGGGSGHEPAFAGYVGRGVADAAAIGNVFASPPPEPILEATRAINADAGVLYLYGNYSGDVMNIDMAAEMAAMEDITARSVAVTDDVASAPADRRGERRGVAGDFFVFKAAGAAAERGLDLDAVTAVAERANARTLTMGVALGPCSMPHTRRPNFELGEEEMEIGLGVHGEPGVERGPLQPADAVVEALLERILPELDAGKGDRVAVLVNGLGSTPLMEQYVMFRRVRQVLGERGIEVQRSFVGNYVTSLEMAGASVTLMKLDDELVGLLDEPARCTMCTIAS